ncbi:hypothetical protein Aph02nite_78310 [Actinoplanes philippinensis]|uniref:Sugar kinase of the NBD/HSP70 family, may contain an N-terminal HTH domain n=1 Tax=Actinoplanes philippinensis TaxID=35752 RepID=A0A1I2KBB5_9ACTN|nr:hypothetical protein Aph02nite_78310 [Actinoplanes philippinensis]SFF64335.1 Sugar kinase of the NBD/HSP70 family, may contain an N-terminal HTH domain [Actinoplanes philippinensis]
MVHEYFDDLADMMIDSHVQGGRVSRQLIGEVLSRVAVNTPPEATRDEIAAGDMLRIPLPLSEGSVSKATAALRDQGFLEDGPVIRGAGRPLTSVRLSKEHWFCIGVHLRQRAGVPVDGWVVAARLDDSETLADVRLEIPQPATASAETLTTVIAAAIRRAVAAPAVRSRARGGRLPLLGIGIAVNCPVRGGTLIDRRDATGLGHDLGADLAEALGAPVIVENDANALAIRQTYGSDIEHQDFALVLVEEEGIGAAVSVGGRVYRGSEGFAGELGHVRVDRAALPLGRFGGQCSCGGEGHVDAYATPRWIRQQPAVHESAAYLTAGRALGHGLTALVGLVNPAQIMLVLTERLGSPALRDVYLEAARAEVVSASASSPGAGVLLTPVVLEGQMLARRIARAAATRVLIEFIDHLSGIDGCLPKDRGAATLTSTRAAAALITPFGAAVGAVVGGAIGYAAHGAAIGRVVGRVLGEGRRAAPIRETEPARVQPGDSARAGRRGWQPPWPG